MWQYRHFTPEILYSVTPARQLDLAKGINHRIPRKFTEKSGVLQTFNTSSFLTWCTSIRAISSPPQIQQFSVRTRSQLTHSLTPKKPNLTLCFTRYTHTHTAFFTFDFEPSSKPSHTRALRLAERERERNGSATSEERR